MATESDVTKFPVNHIGFVRSKAYMKKMLQFLGTNVRACRILRFEMRMKFNGSLVETHKATNKMMVALKKSIHIHEMPTSLAFGIAHNLIHGFNRIFNSPGRSSRPIQPNEKTVYAMIMSSLCVHSYFLNRHLLDGCFPRDGHRGSVEGNNWGAMRRCKVQILEDYERHSHAASFGG